VKLDAWSLAKLRLSPLARVGTPLWTTLRSSPLVKRCLAPLARLRTPPAAVVLLGDRLAVALIDGDAVRAFMIEAEEPAVALRAELDALGASTRDVALGLGRALVSVKPIELPAVTGDVRDMVRFDLDRHLPFSSEDAAFDFAPLPADPEAAQGAPPARRVLVVAADRRVFDSALKLTEGLRPVSLTVAPHDLTALASPERGHRVVWVHRALGAADLLFLVGSSVALSRNVPGGDDAVVADEVRKSLIAARWRSCDAVWVSGDDVEGALAGELARLGAPVEAPPWTPRARVHLDALPTEQPGALMLALAVASAPRVPVLDLLPPALRPRRVTSAQAASIGMGLLSIVLMFGALVVPTLRDTRYLSRVNAEINRLDPDVRSVERLLGELERKRRLLATMEEAQTPAVRPLPVLRELTELLPSDAWLTTVSMDSKGIELTGQANSASALIPLLENSPRFERVEFASPVTRGRDREQFRIRAAWEAPPPTPTPPPGVSTPGPAAGSPPPPRRPPSPGAGSPRQ